MKSDGVLPRSPDSLAGAKAAGITRPPASRSHDASRPSKRPHLGPSYQDENAPLLPLRPAPTVLAAQHRKASSKDEKALLDDLMAGLDASVFDNYEVSPVKPTATMGATRPPLKVKHVVVSPTRPGFRPVKRKLSSRTPPPDLDVMFGKAEPDLKPEEDVVKDVGNDAKDAICDEESYDFDFDLADPLTFDEDLLVKFDSAEVRRTVGCHRKADRCLVRSVTQFFIHQSLRLPLVIALHLGRDARLMLSLLA